ncbi:recombinase family protein [Nonomuraea sp. NEAU-L178]|nr:recombinase family protein [Nonomuraea aurantiaca]
MVGQDRQAAVRDRTHLLRCRPCRERKRPDPSQHRQAEHPAAARRPPSHLLVGLRGEDQRQLATNDRPDPLNTLSYIRDGDPLTVQEVDRLGRNLLEGLIVLNDLFQRGVGVKVLEGIAAGVEVSSASSTRPSQPLGPRPSPPRSPRTTPSHRPEGRMLG